ncbi:MAG: hypothetical protein KF852_16430 [Saprospiraceae bacterium]|nr:hypothetical protein [Saprospiraceae bacterium]
MKNALFLLKPLTIILIVSLHTSCKPDTKPAKAAQEAFAITPLTMMNKTGLFHARGEDHPYKAEYYIVSGFQDDLATETVIDSFMCSNIAGDFKNFHNYSVTFYKESAITNIKALTQNPKDFDRYSFSSDRLYQYNWEYGKFLWVNKIRGEDNPATRFTSPCLE